MPWIYVATTILLTTYGQLIIKWQVSRHGHLPATLAEKVSFFVRLLLNPWVISVFVAAVIAALSWMAAMSQLDLSRAYPFMALSFVLVVLLSGVLFGEKVSIGRVAGVMLIVVGLGVGARF